MGGNALKNTETRRYEKEEFFELERELVPLIVDAFSSSYLMPIEVEVIKAYQTKDSFGDMDILLLSEPGNQRLGSMREVIISKFGPTEVHHNGNCWSFAYKELQIDLILTPKENWETSKVFFAYNDLGNLMGKIYHKFGLKYGYDGVKYPFYIDGKKIGTIEITKDMEKAFEFIGCSWKKFQEGFTDLEDIFTYIIDSSYFDYDSFQFENLNSINKNRNKRRKVYQEFLQYLEDNDIKKSNDWAKDQSVYWEEIADYFPESHLMESIEALKDKEEIRKELAEKFNGNLIMEKFPDLQGPKLGEAIGSFKRSFEDFDKFVMGNDATQIMQRFKKHLWAIQE